MQMDVTFYVTIGPDGLQDYSTCGDYNEVTFRSTNWQLTPITGVSGCPDLQGQWLEQNFQEGFLCTDRRKLATIQSTTYCCKSELLCKLLLVRLFVMILSHSKFCLNFQFCRFEG